MERFESTTPGLSARDEVVETRRLVKQLIEEGHSIASIADETEININTLKQFIYTDTEKPRVTGTFLRIRAFLSKHKLTRRNNALPHEFFGHAIDRTTSDKMIGEYFMYRRSILRENIVKISISILYDESNDLIFNEKIVGLTARRKVNGMIRKYENNIYLKGIIYRDSTVDMEQDADYEIIGEEIITFNESFLKDEFIRANFLSVSGDYKSICGSAFIFRRESIEANSDIGNFKEDGIGDTVLGEGISLFISRMEAAGKPLQTIDN